jgi:hypothetical protein
VNSQNTNNQISGYLSDQFHRLPHPPPAAGGYICQTGYVSRVQCSTLDDMDTPAPLAVPRAAAAKILGVSQSALRDWASQTPPRGPRAIKIGEDRRARCLYPVADIRAWLDDPTGYERRRRSPPNAPRG